MCGVCGCGEGEARIEGKSVHKHHHHHHGEDGHSHSHGDGHTHHHEPMAEHSHAPGLTQSRMVQIEQDILAKNNQYANANRHYFAEHGLLALNFVSSPGSGKTSLLVRTIDELKDTLRFAVVEGDQQTTNDADRIRQTGAPAIQINTGKGCHLDGHMVGHAVEGLELEDGGVLFIENVGNLVCPASFDLGEAHKVVILSVTEGDDKPAKYPDMFHAADLMLINKIDLLPHVDFDIQKCIEHARSVNRSIKVLQISATSGEGLEQFYQWIKLAREMALTGHPAQLKKQAEGNNNVSRAAG